MGSAVPLVMLLHLFFSKAGMAFTDRLTEGRANGEHFGNCTKLDAQIELSSLLLLSFSKRN